MAFVSLSECLTHTDLWTSARSHIEGILRLGKALEAALPPHLASLCKVANIRATKNGHTAILLAVNGHTLAALRQLSPRIIAALSHADSRITHLRFSIAQTHPHPATYKIAS